MEAKRRDTRDIPSKRVITVQHSKSTIRSRKQIWPPEEYTILFQRKHDILQSFLWLTYNIEDECQRETRSALAWNVKVSLETKLT